MNPPSTNAYQSKTLLNRAIQTVDGHVMNKKILEVLQQYLFWLGSEKWSPAKCPHSYRRQLQNISQGN